MNKKAIKRYCLKCNSPFIYKRNPNQQYCSQRDCQTIRKREWYKSKRKNDLDYQHNHNKACKKWRSTNSDYSRNYRDSHPEYAQRNRQLQQERDRKRSKLYTKQHTSHLAKSDALTATALVPEGRYRLIPENCDLAKSDALIVNLVVISTSYEHFADLAKI